MYDKKVEQTRPLVDAEENNNVAQFWAKTAVK